MPTHPCWNTFRWQQKGHTLGYYQGYLKRNIILRKHMICGCKNKKSILPPLISRRMLIFHTQRCVCLPLGSLNIDFVVSVHCVYFIILTAVHVHFSLALVFHLMPRRKSMLTRNILKICSLHRSLSKYMLFNYRDL